MKSEPMRSYCVIASIFLTSAPIFGEVHVVEPGDDLQAVADKLEAGDTMRFAPGVYREKVVTRSSGHENAPIRIDGGGEAKFYGLSRLEAEFRELRDGTFQADVDLDQISQLFVDGEPMSPARWPNMSFDERWDNSKWPAADEGAKYGTMIDADLAKAGINFKGCVAILNVGSWQTFRRVITDHKAG
ncbi:MAG: hypothetical protein AAF585_25325, partial [Verrucomicrobiota bacterium]